MELMILNGANGNIRIKEGEPCKINGNSDNGIITKIVPDLNGYEVYKKKGDIEILYLKITNCSCIEINETIEEAKIEEVKNGNRKKNNKNGGFKN